jgi:hypothetical protein
LIPSTIVSSLFFFPSPFSFPFFLLSFLHFFLSWTPRDGIPFFCCLWFVSSIPLCIPCFLFLYPGFPMFIGLWLYH